MTRRSGIFVEARARRADRWIRIAHCNRKRLCRSAAKRERQCCRPNRLRRQVRLADGNRVARHGIVRSRCQIRRAVGDACQRIAVECKCR
ncbi:hypothetical protein D3C78_962610 [compost metagenome]